MKKIISMLLAVVMCFSLMTVSFAAEMNFTDVKSTDWFYNDVKTAVEMGLVNGKSATTYAPNDNLTYAEAIKLAACMNMLYTQGEINIKAGSPWYQPYVDYCVEYNIIDKEYDYNANATRAGYMGIFAKALPEEGFGVINDVPDNSIPDVPSSRAYAPAVYKLYRAGILTGVDAAHNCNPLANITRAEVAAILTRMMNEAKRVKITDMGKAEEAEPEVKEPEVKEPEATEPEVKEPEVKEPEVKDPEVKEPETTEPEVKEPETSKALTIKTHPVSKTVGLKEAANFTVEAEGGTEPYTYRWQMIKNSAWADITTSAFYNGVTTKTLKAISTSTREETIRCVVTDAAGNSVTTGDAKFTVVAADPLTVKINNDENYFEVDEGSDLRLTTAVTGGTGSYTYQWKVKKDGSTTWNDGVTASTFTVVGASDEDNNKLIKVEVKDANGWGVTSKEVRIVVNESKGSSLGERPSTSRPTNIGALAIKTQSGDMKGCVGIFTLNVEVEGGTAPYTYVWMKETVTENRNGTKTSKYIKIIDTDGTIKGAKTATLMVSLTSLDTYKYKCEVIDANGNTVTSDVITITVNAESNGGRVSIPTGGKLGY